MIIIRIRDIFHPLTNNDVGTVMHTDKPRLNLGLGVKILFRILLISGFITLYFYSWILIY